ncbi:MAG: hypothetical protein RJQ09_05690 [Cyclobacteriaceae bacterium]
MSEILKYFLSKLDTLTDQLSEVGLAAALLIISLAHLGWKLYKYTSDKKLLNDLRRDPDIDSFEVGDNTNKMMVKKRSTTTQTRSTRSFRK